MTSSGADFRVPLRHAPPTLFIAYARENRDWVEGFLRPELGLPAEAVITDESFRPGAPVVSELEQAVGQARYTVLVLSEAFMADQWAVFGELLASHADVGQSNRIIPLLLEPCELPLHIDFRVRLDCTNPEGWTAELARLRRVLGRDEPPNERIACPYPGMVSFGSHDAPFFYGRDREIDDLAHRLRHQHFLLIVGPSGSGKSSLISAGLLPRLAHADDSRWFIRTMRPGPTPLEALASALGSRPQSEMDELLSRISEHRRVGERTLLVVDPFEEVFTQASADARAKFLQALMTLRGTQRCALLLLMRADFYADLMTCPLWPISSGERVEITPLQEAELRQAIASPARDVGVHLEPVLIERLLHDAADEPGALPLMQETMVLLWERRIRRLLTLRAYESLGADGRGGLATALATQADAVLATMSPAQVAITRRILLRLIHLSEDHGDTRRQQPVAALKAGSEDGGDFERTLRHLADQRLVIVSGEEGDPTGDRRTADLAHELLIQGWPTLRGWVEQSRADELVRRQITRDADDWADRRHERGSLYRGRRLAAALDWMHRYPHELGGRERSFLTAGSRWRAVNRSVVALILLAFLAGVAWLAVPPAQQWTWRNEARTLGPTVRLAGGVALIGSKPTPVVVPALRVDVHEVTSRQFRLCVRAHNCLEPVEPFDESPYHRGDQDLPVVFVTAYQAADYCSWVGRRLPTEAEWERAARGLTGRRYPWGSAKPDTTRVEAVIGDVEPPSLVPVDDNTYAAGKTPEGIAQLIGGVREWVRTRVRFDEKLDEKTTDQLRRLGDWNGRDRVDVLAVKGGGWKEEPLAAYFADSADATTLDVQTGFRCVSTEE
jgi:energy-coupling factor transporter ATP-binding protein EcfA2